MLQLLPLLLVAAPFQSDAAPAPERTPVAALPEGHVHPVEHLVRIEGERATSLLRLQQLDLDVLRSEYTRGYVEAIVTDEEIRAVEELGLDVEMVTRDLAAFYARRLASEDPAAVARSRGSIGQWLTPAFGSGSVGGYYSFAEIVSVLDQFRATYPNLVAPKMSIGTTIQGRDIWMIRVSDNPTVDENEPEMRIDAMHHAREPQGMQTTLYFVSWLLESYGTDPLATYILEERELYVIPCVNPDGYEYNRSIAPGGGGLWRKNRRNNGNGTFGVDLNRNYPFQWGGAGSSGNTDSEIYRGPSPSSEPETTDMIQFIDSRSFQTSLTVHTFGDLWLAPWGYIAQFPPDWDELQELGDLAVELSGYPNGPAGILLGVAAGATDDYDYGAQDIYSWTPEIGNSSDGFWPLQSRIVPLAENNRIAFARTALGAGAWLRPESALVADAGDGDGSFEAGEDVSLTLLVRNSGRGTAAAGTISLTTTSPDAVVVDALSTVDAPSFTTGQNQSPLTLRIAAGTPAGTVVPYRLTVTDGPLEQSLDGTLVVGEIVIADFDFEAAGDEGWAVGAPNDASTGNWVRVDPVGTQAQPENDNTPGAGVRCWVTGQGAVGGGLGANDVDGGSTTLVSPVFDLSTATAATVSYARWYSNDAGAGPSADVFEVDVSNDEGATWTSAETVGPTGASGGWEDASIDLGALLALTDAMRVRFVASDLGAGSIVEAAVDDVRVAAIVDAGCPAPKIYCVGEPNAVGPGASIVAFGSQDTLNDDLTLSASGVLPSNFGLFFHGQGRIDSPLGNGRFCVGGSVVRMPIVQADGLGFATYAVDFAADAPFIDNGETWSFQYWYRDVGGDGYNFSDAVEVTFCAD